MAENADITLRQIENMKHCIGFRGDRVKGRKYRKYVAYRNYHTTSDNNLNWDELVKLELAVKRSFPSGVGDNPQCYFVTEKGMELLGKLLECEIVEDKD